MTGEQSGPALEYDAFAELLDLYNDVKSFQHQVSDLLEQLRITEAKITEQMGYYA